MALDRQMALDDFNHCEGMTLALSIRINTGEVQNKLTINSEISTINNAD